MKRLLLLLTLLFILPFSVDAVVYNKNDLIPVDNYASVDTDLFSYNDFIYSSAADSKGNCFINFNSITNKTLEKMPVSIDVLLFDENMKNIGLVSYCSLKDYGNQYEGVQINGGESSVYSIKVSTKYMALNKMPVEVKYIAVMDENKYCYIGGYTKYQGMTIEQILGEEKIKDKTNNLFSFLDNKELMNNVLIIGGVVVLLFALGGLLNSVYSKLYGNSTIMAFVPILNIYVLFRVAFGNVIGIIGFLISCLLGVLYIFISKVFLIPLIVIVTIPLLVDIIKFFTGRASLFIFGINFRKSSDTVKSSMESENVYSRPLDLTYSSEGIVQGDGSGSVDIGSNNSLLEEDSNTTVNNNSNQTNNNGGSDLTNMYK